MWGGGHIVTLILRGQIDHPWYWLCYKNTQTRKFSFILTFIVSRTCPRWFFHLIERLCIIISTAVILLYLRIVVISGGFSVSFSESDNPTSFHLDIWTRFRTYSYLCALNARFLLCPNTLCYDWSMDSIPRIESWWDTRNAETLIFTLVMALLGFYGEQLMLWSLTNHEEDGDKSV